MRYPEDWYDVEFRDWLSRVKQNFRDLRCHCLGHIYKYIAPGPWDWDGEWSTYCPRCEDPEGGVESAFSRFIEYGDERGFWTIPERVRDIYSNVRWYLGIDKYE